MSNQALNNRLEKLSQWRYAGIALLVFIAVNAIILSMVERFKTMTNGTDMIELPNMVSQDLYAIAQSYPAEALRFYQQVLQPLDIVYPATLGLFLVLLLATLTVRIFPSTSRYRYLPLLGLLPTVADWLENIGVFFILRTVDTPQPIFAVWTKTFIVVKMATSTVILLALALLIIWIIRTIAQRRQQASPQA